MKKRGLAALAMKIMGVFYLVQAVPFAFSVLFSREIMDNPRTFIPAAGVFAAGLLLLLGGGIIGNYLVPQEDNDTVSSSLSVGDWQAVFFSAIGVSTVVRGIQSVSAYFTFPKFTMQLQSLVSGIVMTAIGLALFLQARGLAVLWRFIQERGAPPDAGS